MLGIHWISYGHLKVWSKIGYRIVLTAFFVLYKIQILKKLTQKEGKFGALTVKLTLTNLSRHAMTQITNYGL
jgi:hypothetical protein